MATTTTPRRTLLDYAPHWMKSIGVRSWLLLGFAGVAAIVLWLLSLSVSIFIPLIVAVILGILFVPVVDWMERHGMPRSAGAGITMLLLIVIAIGIGWLVASSVAAQWPQIQAQVTAGIDSVQKWIASLALPKATTDQFTQTVQSQAPKLGQGVANALFSGISNLAAFAFGAFLAFYMLFFTLKDNVLIRHWTAAHLGLPAELGDSILGDASASIRQYFKGTTIIALTTTAATAIGLWIIGVPLIAAISVVTFVMSYIPFFGAILSGAFAVLIALGTGGLPMALWTLLVVLLAQNVLQSVIQAWAIGSALSLHPLVVLIATTLGGIFGGLIGGMLGAPLAAVAVRATERLKAANFGAEDSSPPPKPGSAVAAAPDTT